MKQYLVMTAGFFIALWSLGQIGCSSSGMKPSSLAKTTGGSRMPTSLGPNPSYPLHKYEALLSNEPALIEQIKDGMLAIQANFGKANGGHLLRGTHAKGICTTAEMEIYDVSKLNAAVAGRLKKGIFAQSGTYSAQVRFANAAGNIQSDAVNDVRAISFSMKVPPDISNPQGLMDFSMNDRPTFPINDAQVFADLMTLAALQAKYPNSDIQLLRATYATLGVKRATAALAAAQVTGPLQERESGHTTPYQKLRYWSDVPFALGEDEAVKYSLKPCEENRSQPLQPVTEALALELQRSLQNDPNSCFEFQVQFLEPNKMTNMLDLKKPGTYWVENSLYEWDEDQSPFYTVGRLTLAQGSTLDAGICEKWHINVTANNNVTHRGLGSINRARGAAELASANQRLSP